MNKKIKTLYHSVQVICSCGHTFETKSTYSQDILKIDICSNCHPFYNQSEDVKRVDKRSEQFNEKFGF